MTHDDTTDETDIDIELTTDDTHPTPVTDDTGRSPDSYKQYDSRSDADYLAKDFQRGYEQLRERLTGPDSEYADRVEDISCYVNGFDLDDVGIPTATYTIAFDRYMRPAQVEEALLGDDTLQDVRELTYDRDPEGTIVTATCMQTAFIPEGRRAVSPGGLNFDTSGDTDTDDAE